MSATALPTWSEQVAKHVCTYGEEQPESARAYFELVNYFGFYRGQVVSIEILPNPTEAQDGSHLLVDGNAMAVGKKSLVKAYVYARSAFFGTGNDVYSQRGSVQTQCIEKTQAARVMLLFDPENLTASNHLKRAVVNQVAKTGTESSIVIDELTFLQSLLTSPLHKHSKSPTLWYHRFWLVNTCTPWEHAELVGGRHDKVPAFRKMHTAYKRIKFWSDERKLVLQAAEQHEKNYHAFLYLRRLWSLLWSDPEIAGWHSRADCAGSETLMRLSKWCKAHPRDISGWTFFVWMCCRPQNGHNTKITAYHMIHTLKMWQERLNWRGDSLEWTIKTMELLSPAYFPKAPICQLRASARQHSTQGTHSTPEESCDNANCMPPSWDKAPDIP